MVPSLYFTYLTEDSTKAFWSSVALGASAFTLS
jgi:hypothetical protein